MRILTLNTWGGRASSSDLLAFFAHYKDTVDVFCLQEMWASSYGHLGEYKAGGVDMKDVRVMEHGVQEVAELLSNHTSFFHPHHLDNYGLQMLVSKKYEISEVGEVFVHKEKGYVPQDDVAKHARNVQYVKLLCNNKPLTVMNFHGLWNGQGKTDSDERIVQSQKIVNFLKTLEGEIIFCGDFNLLPDTESIKILEDAGLRNLVREYGVTSTRTPLYTKSEKFADYIFVSKGLSVTHFEVLQDVVSDHSPLLLEIAL